MTDQTQLKRYGLFDAKVPRYTSYPPATQFSGKINDRHYGNWLSQVPGGARISLYLHIPFCRRLCWFCACRTQGINSDDPIIAYVDSLIQEIATVRAQLPRNVEVQRLHWGGGTPTLLSPALMETLGSAIHAAFQFAQDAEFSVEVDPNEIDADRTQTLADIGMTRASIGVQDFDPEIQETIGRIQPYDVTARAVEWLRSVGIHSLNADILFGLPGQSQAKLTSSVQQLLSLSPDRVALYGYAHVPWVARRQTMIPTNALPTPQERLAAFDTARRLFAWDGYNEIGIDHFAHPSDSLAVAARAGSLRRNFQGYTDDTCDVLIGLGASSISRFPQGYAQNASSTADYQRAARAGSLATKRGHAFTKDDILRARMIEGLMCDFRIDRTEMITLGASEATLTQCFDTAAQLFDGMVTVSPNGFEITPQGRPLCRMIARAFDAYDLNANGHSLAF